MTVQDLIEELVKVRDKSKQVNLLVDLYSGETLVDIALDCVFTEYDDQDYIELYSDCNGNFDRVTVKKYIG